MHLAVTSGARHLAHLRAFHAFHRTPAFSARLRALLCCACHITTVVTAFLSAFVTGTTHATVARRACAIAVFRSAFQVAGAVGATLLAHLGLAIATVNVALPTGAGGLAVFSVTVHLARSLTVLGALVSSISAHQPTALPHACLRTFLSRAQHIN